MTLIRENLMTRGGYSPYCGNPDCRLNWPRTHFNGRQFVCGCGWKSQFDDKFIAEYKAKWSLK